MLPCKYSILTCFSASSARAPQSEFYSICVQHFSHLQLVIQWRGLRFELWLQTTQPWQYKIKDMWFIMVQKCWCHVSVFATRMLVWMETWPDWIFRARFWTVKWWQSTCLNSAAPRANRQKKSMTTTHSHTAASEGKPTFWRIGTEGRGRRQGAKDSKENALNGSIKW